MTERENQHFLNCENTLRYFLCNLSIADAPARIHWTDLYTYMYSFRVDLSVLKIFLTGCTSYIITAQFLEIIEIILVVSVFNTALHDWFTSLYWFSGLNKDVRAEPVSVSISFCNVISPPLENEHQTETGCFKLFLISIIFHYWLLVYVFIFLLIHWREK